MTVLATRLKINKLIDESFYTLTEQGKGEFDNVGQNKQVSVNNFTFHGLDIDDAVSWGV